MNYKTQVNHNRKRKKILAAVLAALMLVSLAACSGQDASQTASDTDEAQAADEQTTDQTTEQTSAAEYLTRYDINVDDSFVNNTDGEHSIEVDNNTVEYINIGVIKTGDSSGDEADFYGENSAVFATNEAELSIRDSLIETEGTHANAVFSYGEGTVVNITDSVINTTGNCSGGIMTTGGGTMNAENLTINTTGNSSAAIRSDRGGGTVNVTKGYYKTTGTGSPVIYSTADITVSDAYMESTASQGVVVEGKNSVTLNNDTLIADNNTKNSDKSEYYQAVMIYQSMSGDAAMGTSSFTANGGSINNQNGDIFFVNNTATEIFLGGVDITNEDTDGCFLRAQAAGWGNEGSNGGMVNLNASGQVIDGDMIVDEVSALNLYLKEGSSYMGAINTDGQNGEVYVEIEDGSTWQLTADSYVSGLTVGDANAIDLNGHKLYVDGAEYAEGSASEGTAFDITTNTGSSSGSPDGMPGDGQNGSGGNPPEKPDGDGQGGPGGNPPGGEPPEKPDGNGQGAPGGTPPGGEPPEKPDGSN